MKSFIMKSKFQIIFIALCLLIFISILILRNQFLGVFEERTKNVCSNPCQLDNVITVRHGGRLGNCVWEYVSVMGLQEILGLCPYMPKSILNCLQNVFQNLKIPAYEDTLLSNHCRSVHHGDVKKCKSKILPHFGASWERLCYKLTNGASIAPVVAHKPITELRKLKDSGKLSSILILPRWIAQSEAFIHVGINKFKQEFQFRDDVKQLTEQTLKGVIEKVGRQSDMILIGVHVRRTDYQHYLSNRFGKNVTHANVSYYKNAMNRMLDIYADSRLVFVIVSDDREWCISNLVNEKEEVFWGGLQGSSFIKKWKDHNKLGAAHDLAVLAMLNHSIIGYGTFGVTGSLLSGGHTIACNISKRGVADNLTTRLAKVLPNWELL